MITFVLTLTGWVVVAVCFEGVYQFARPHLAGSTNKKSACRAFWSFVGIVSLLNGHADALFSLLAMLPVAFVQVHLSDGSEEMLTFGEVKTYLIGVWIRVKGKLGL